MKKQKILLYKTISYRLLGSITTTTITFYFSHEWTISIGAGVTDLIVKPIIYYLHELMWFKKIKKSE